MNSCDTSQNWQKSWSRVKPCEAKLLCWAALKRASSRVPPGNKKKKIEGRNGDKSEGEWRFWQKLRVYRPARCPAEEITCRGKRSSRQNIAALLSALALALLQPGAIFIPIHLARATGAAGETCRPLKPLLTWRRRRQSGQSDVTKTSLLQPLSRRWW